MSDTPITRRALLRSAAVATAAVPAAAAILAAPGAARADSRRDEFQRFERSDYTYCDANVLARFWGQDTLEAKARIGRKIGWGDTDILEGMLREARAKAAPQAARVCPTYDNGYSHADMQALALFWDHRLLEAKSRASTKLVHGDKAVLDSVLNQAWDNLPTRKPRRTRGR